MKPGVKEAQLRALREGKVGDRPAVLDEGPPRGQVKPLSGSALPERKVVVMGNKNRGYTYPRIVLEGPWLSALGFSIGEVLRGILRPGSVTIRKEKGE